MASAPMPANEMKRLKALHSYDILDQKCDPAFERLIRVAADVCDVEISVIALIDHERQFFFARNGMQPTETPRAIAFCAHAILEPHKTFEIPDATKDPRFADNPLVTGEVGVRFYAAQPLTTSDGLAIGGLCLIGKTPKTLTDTQRSTLQNLAAVIMSMLETRKVDLENQRRLREARDTCLAALKKVVDKTKQLDEKNTHFHSALENMTQGLSMYNGEQRLIVCNRRYAEMYGLSPDLTKPGTRLSEIVQQRIANGIFAGDAPEDYMEERAEWGEKPKEDSKLQHMSDGRTILIVRRPLSGGGWVSTHDDITELSNAQTDLEKMNRRVLAEKERFRSLYRSTPVMMHSIDEDGVIVDANEFWQPVMGYRPEEVIGRRTIEFMTEESRTYAKESVLPAFWRDGFCKDIPYQFIRKNGDIIDVRLSAVVSLSIEDGKRRSLACVIDVSNQANAERELARVNTNILRERERLNEIYRRTPVMLHSICENGEIVEVSDYWCEKMGYSHDEVIGRLIYDFMSPVSAEVMRNENAPKLFAGGKVDNVHYTYIRKDGSRMEVRLSAITGQNFDTNRLQTFTVVFDVTDQVRAERELLRHRDDLRALVHEATADLEMKAQELECALEREKELNQMQRQFVAMVSHEFRTPLAIIDSSAQRLKKDAEKDSPDAILQRADKIRGAVGRMTQLMESTLTSARLDEGVVAVNIQPCDIASIVFEICSHHQEIASKHLITCDAYSLPASIKADAAALEQMLTNLISNAVKYSPDNPEIHVRAYGDGSNVILQVRDQGLGIDDNDLPGMFSRFFRAKTASGIHGTGIGLSLVKKLVELHGGTITVESKKDSGSTFTITLPIDGPSSQSEQAA